METADGGAATADAGELVAEFLRAFVASDSDALAELVTEDCILHQPRWPLVTEGREAILEGATRRGEMFTDVTVVVDETVVSDDRIAVFATVSGRNVGPMQAEHREIAPTGRTFEVPQFGIYRIEDGKIAEAWVLADALGIVEQLGNLPKGPTKMLGILVRQLRWRLGGKKRLE